MDYEDPIETPFDPINGILFKYGRIYLDRSIQIEAFEGHCGVRLPEDFLALIGDWCEGGFDGWYRVKKGEFGRIVWTHLLLMKLPDDTDRELERGRDQQHGTRIVSDLLEMKRHLFFSAAGRLRYFPFGEATCIRADESGDDGYLAFDVANQSLVVFLTGSPDDLTPVARTFSEMLAGSVFEFFG